MNLLQILVKNEIRPRVNQTQISSPAPKRVAIIRLSSAGDIVLTSPAVESLKTAWPNTEIIYVTKQAYQPLIESNPLVSNVVPWTKTDTVASIRKQLLELNVETILDLHNSQRSKLLRWSLPTLPSAVWQKRPLMTNLTVRWMLKPYSPEMTIAARYHDAVEQLVGKQLPQGHLRYFLRPTEAREAATLLQDAGLDLDKPIIGVSPGAKWHTKRWPAERFGEVIRRAHQQGFQSIITGSLDEMSLAETIQESCPDSINLIGKVPFNLLGGIIGLCNAFLANDSGPMHISRGLGVPTLAFFGSTAPEQFHFEGHSLLFSNEPCAPCHFYGRHKCPKKHLHCLTNITVNNAWESLKPLLDGNKRPLVQG